MAEKTQRKPQRRPGAAGKKKQWEPPRVTSGRLFESNSLACGKTGEDAAMGSDGGQCARQIMVS